MKPTTYVLLVIAFLAAGASAQILSAKSMREMLKADVKRFGNDGRLIAAWKLQEREQLERGFKIEQAERGRARIKKGALSLNGKEDGQVRVSFKELAFRRPFTMEFEMRLGDAATSFITNLQDGADSDAEHFCFINTKIYSNETSAFDGIWQINRGRPLDSQLGRRARWSPGRWYAISLVLDKKGPLTLRGPGGAIATHPFNRNTFQVSFTTRRGEVELRDLRIDGYVDMASARKLARSLEAQTSESPNKRRTGFALLEFERSLAQSRKYCIAEVNRLSVAAQREMMRGQEASGKGQTAQALDAYRKAGRIAKAPVCDLFIGEVLHAMGRETEAFVAWRKATRATKGGFSEALTNMAEYHLNDGDLPAAVKCVDAAQAADPKDPWIHVVEARIRSIKGDLVGAEAALRALKKKRPKSRGATLALKELERIKTPPAWKRTHTRKNKYYVIQTNVTGKLASDLSRRLLYYRRFLERAFPLPDAARSDVSPVWVFDSEEGYHRFGASHSRVGTWG